LIAPAVQESRAVDRNALREDETKQILRVLEETRGNRSIAARRLGMSRSTFYRRLAELGLAAPTRR
jgi:transcriptional regulator of acetoin/glycerol metabolism